MTLVPAPGGGAYTSAGIPGTGLYWMQHHHAGVVPGTVAGEHQVRCHYRKPRPEHLNPVRPIDNRRGRCVNRLSLISRRLTGIENETRPHGSLPERQPLE
jgi:hypothetical protein